MLLVVARYRLDVEMYQELAIWESVQMDKPVDLLIFIQEVLPERVALVFQIILVLLAVHCLDQQVMLQVFQQVKDLSYIGLMMLTACVQLHVQAM